MFIVLSLAIGIATSTAVFSLAYGVLIKPLPIDDPEGIVNVYQVSANLRELQEFSYPVFQELKERRDLFEDLLAYDHMTVDLGTGEKPQRLRSAIVSDNYFEMLGVGVTIGSTFSRGVPTTLKATRSLPCSATPSGRVILVGLERSSERCSALTDTRLR